MTRNLALSGLMLAALAAGGCTSVFEPIEPEAVGSTIDRMDRAETARQGVRSVHSECMVETQARSQEARDRIREICGTGSRP
jgi:hypothetical protein